MGTKPGPNTQERIMEIVGFLLRQILEAPDTARHQGRLVRGLVKKGYRQAEIDAAIELVLAVPEIISSTTTVDQAADLAGARRPGIRVFSPVEQAKLGLAVRGQLHQYRMLGLLTEIECEQVLLQLLLLEAPEAGMMDLYVALRKVIAEEERLLLLVPDATPPVSVIIN